MVQPKVTANMQIPAGDSRQGSAEKMTDDERWTGAPVTDLPHNRNPRRKSMQVDLVGSDYSRQRITASAHQDLPFVASFAADMTPPVICLICSPALVN